VKTGFRKNSEDLLSWETGLPVEWTKTQETKMILGHETTLFHFTINNVNGRAWIARNLKHNHIYPFKYLIGLLRGEKFPSLLFPNNLFGYNFYGMILEAQIDDKNGARALKVKNMSKSADLKMLDLSDVVIRDL
jgi:hypothetical protein